MFIDSIIKREQLEFNSLHEYVDYIKRVNQKAFFLPMLVAGLPNIPACAEIIIQLESIGVRIIELFIPTSDAFLETKNLSKAMDYAIATDIHTSDCFDLISLVRQRGCRIPIILRSYFSSVFNYGISKFIKKCNASGVNILNLENLPLSKIQEISPYLKRNKMEFTCELSKNQDEERIAIIDNNVNNISMVYKNILSIDENGKSVVSSQITDEISHLKEQVGKDISICGSFNNIDHENNIKNLSDVIDCIDTFSFKSYLAPLQYIQSFEPKELQEKELYEKNNIIISRVVEKAKEYINIDELMEAHVKLEEIEIDNIIQERDVDIDNLIDNEVTTDVIDLKTKEEREKESLNKDQELHMEIDKNLNIQTTDDDQKDNLSPEKQSTEIAKNVNNTILVDNEEKEKITSTILSSVDEDNGDQIND